MPVKESCLHPGGADFRLDVGNSLHLKSTPHRNSTSTSKINAENSDCPVFGTIQVIKHSFSMLFHRLQRIPPSLLHDVRRGGSWRSVEVQFGTLQRQKDKRAARGIGQLHQVAKILKRSQWYGQKLLKFGKMSSTCTGYLKKVLN